MLRSFALAITLLGLISAAPPAEAQTLHTGWLGSSDYQQFFDNTVVPGGFMPVSVQAGLYYGHLRFEGVFVPSPAGVAWITHHGLSDARFWELNQQYLARGYRMTFHDRFDTEGMIANQGIWAR